MKLSERIERLRVILDSAAKQNRRWAEALDRLHAAREDAAPRNILDELKETREDLEADLYRVELWRVQTEAHVLDLERRCLVIFNSDFRRRLRWMLLGALFCALALAMAGVLLHMRGCL